MTRASSSRAPRRDAQRNRGLILEAARRLLAEKGAARTSIEDVAGAAGVAKGTVFRHFSDRASLMTALLDERERELQEAILRGGPPLGPDAEPRERLIAFGRARLAMLEDIGDVLADAEVSRGAARLLSPVRATYHAHVALLLRDAGAALDPELTADVLMEALTAQLFIFERTQRGRTLAELQDGWSAMVSALWAAGPADDPLRAR